MGHKGPVQTIQMCRVILASITCILHIIVHILLAFHLFVTCIIQKALENGDINKRDSGAQQEDPSASSSKTAENGSSGKLPLISLLISK